MLMLMKTRFLTTSKQGESAMSEEAIGNLQLAKGLRGNSPKRRCFPYMHSLIYIQSIMYNHAKHLLSPLISCLCLYLFRKVFLG